MAAAPEAPAVASRTARAAAGDLCWREAQGPPFPRMARGDKYSFGYESAMFDVGADDGGGCDDGVRGSGCDGRGGDG